MLRGAPVLRSFSTIHLPGQTAFFDANIACLLRFQPSVKALAGSTTIRIPRLFRFHIMRRSKGSSPKLSADSQRLATLAEAVVQAGSRLEERSWERSLDAHLIKLLKSSHQDTIDAALDYLFLARSGAYEALMESVETVSASAVIEHDGKSYDALLIAIPILAWTRFAIASGPLASDVVLTLSAQLSGHVLATGTHLAMAPTLFAIDQLPRSHVEAYALTQRMAKAALTDSTMRAGANPEETAPFLADTRYVLAVVAAPSGAPLFQWQMPEGTANPVAEQERILAQWRAQVTPTVQRLLPGCGIELLLPEAYYAACRVADRQIRPASIRAAIHYLTHTLAVEPEDLSAIIGDFSENPMDQAVDEHRVSFTLRGHPEVIYGIVWPLYEEDGAEEAQAALMVPALRGEISPDSAPLSSIEQILALLRQDGVVHIKRHKERFPIEFCEDCGAPLFCDAEGELTHAEMPEEAGQAPTHLH